MIRAHLIVRNHAQLAAASHFRSPFYEAEFVKRV